MHDEREHLQRFLDLSFEMYQHILTIPKELKLMLLCKNKNSCISLLVVSPVWIMS